MVCVGRRPYTETLGLKLVELKSTKEDKFQLMITSRPPVHQSTPSVTSSEAPCWLTRPKTKASSVLNILLAKMSILITTAFHLLFTLIQKSHGLERLKKT